MIRNFKALGLTLVAAFAMSAVVVSAASASEFTAAEAKAVLTAEQIAVAPEHNAHTFTAGIRSFVCATALFEGTATSPSKTVTVTPTYSNCSVEVANWAATVTHNGCNYNFNEPHKGPPGEFTGSVNLVCPAGKVIEVHAYTSAANHASGTSVCTITVSPFENKGVNQYTNDPAAGGVPDQVTVTTTVTGIPIKIHGSALLCGTQTEATYTAASIVRAYKDEATAEQPFKHGAQIGATVS